MKAELFAIKNQPPVVTSNNDMEISRNDSSPIVTVVTTYVRVCFLGWMEFYDDWIDINPTAGRLAPLNTKSFGNRGDNNIREEVKFLSKFWEKKSQVSPGSSYATSPEPAIISPFYASIVDRFLLSRGIINVQKILAEKMQEDCNLSSSSNFKLILSFGFCADVLTSRFFEVTVTPNHTMFTGLIYYIERFFHFRLEEELRATKTEQFEQIIWAMEQILKSHGVDMKDVARIVDPLWLKVSLECIRSPYLNRYFF